MLDREEFSRLVRRTMQVPPWQVSNENLFILFRFLDGDSNGKGSLRNQRSVSSSAHRRLHSHSTWLSLSAPPSPPPPPPTTTLRSRVH